MAAGCKFSPPAAVGPLTAGNARKLLGTLTITGGALLLLSLLDN